VLCSVVLGILVRTSVSVEARSSNCTSCSRLK
jgi:hypothetical protein